MRQNGDEPACVFDGVAKAWGVYNSQTQFNSSLLYLNCWGVDGQRLLNLVWKQEDLSKRIWQNMQTKWVRT